ncbi:unnamed protein product [Laminaria digitata]
MEPFDAERFVDRLVEDDPSPWRCNGGGGLGQGPHLWEAPGGADPGTGMMMMTGHSSRSASTSAAAAKLFLQPIYSWPLEPQQQQQLPPLEAPSHSSVFEEGSRGMPIVVPHDPILDALFTPARATSPEIVPTVTTSYGLVGLGGGGSSNFRDDAVVSRFEPAPVFNIPPQQHQQEQWPTQRTIPLATTNTILQQQQQQQQENIPGKVFGGSAFSATTTAVPSVATISSATATIAATRAAATSAVAAATATASSAPAPPPQLTGADGFSDEYDDEQHDFLRRQEVALFVGPGYLAGPGRPGLVTPAARTSVVAWLCEVHAAAPSASCGALTGVGVGGIGGARTSFAGAAALRVAAAASLALASKYEDTQAASLWGVAAASALVNSAASCCCCPGGSAESRECFCGGGVEGIGGGGVGGGGGGDVRAARKELAAMELRVASALGFRLTVPTALSFLGVFMRRADALGYLARGAGSERVREEAQQILLCVLRDACSLEHPPSALAAAALYWASCVTAPGAAAPAAFSFFAVTGYQLERLCRCLRDMEGVRTGGGGGRRQHRLSVAGGVGGGGGGGGDWAGAAFPEHAERSLFDAGGGHPAIAAL